jgi:hypothetical protein
MEHFLKRCLSGISLPLIGVLLGHAAIFGQNGNYYWGPQINGPDAGVPIVGYAMPPDATYGSTYFSASSNTIYTESEYNGAISRYGIWNLPEGHGAISDIKYGIDSINGAGVKILTTTGEVFFLLNDKPHTYPIVDWKKIPSTESQGWKSIKGDDVYVLSTLCLWVTRDRGASWKTDTAGLAGARVTDFSLDSNRNVYIATTNGLYKQGPHDSAWAQFAASEGAKNCGSLFVDRKGRILATLSLVQNGPLFIYLSTDNGETWNIDTAGIGSGSVPAQYTDDVFGNFYGGMGSGKLFRSIGGTGAWQEIDSGIVNQTVASTTINSLFGDSLLHAGTNFGAFISKDQGNTWTDANTGLQTQNYYGFLKQPSGKLLVSTDFGIYARNAGDTIWTKVYPQKGYLGNLPLLQGSLGMICTLAPTGTSGAKGILLSLDSGATWSADTVGFSTIKTGLFFVDETGTEHAGTTQYGSSFYDLVYSKVRGGNWVLDTTGFKSTNYSFTTAFGSNKQGLFYLSGYFVSSNVPVNACVLRRPLGGGAWVPDTNGLGSTLYFDSFFSDKNGNMFGKAGSSLFHHSGTSWSKVAPPAEATYATISGVSVDSSGALFVAFKNSLGRSGVSFSSDNGATWTYAGLDSLAINGLVSYGDSTYAYSDHGIFILTRTAYTAVIPKKQAAAIMPSFVSASKPFGSTTQITYRVTKASRVTLSIFDVAGREVRRLVDEQKTPGDYSVTWSGAKPANGAYLLCLRCSNETLTRLILR